MTFLENTGRRLVFWGAIILMGWAIYEFAVMFNAMRGLIVSIFEISADARYPISKAISTMMKNSGKEFLTLLYLLVCILFGLYALLSRKNPVLSFLSIPAAIALAVYSLGLTTLTGVNLLQKFKMIPFLLIAAGGIICFIFALQRRRKRKQKQEYGGALPPRQHYDPFGINKP